MLTLPMKEASKENSFHISLQMVRPLIRIWNNPSELFVIKLL